MQLDEKYKGLKIYISGPISGCENLNRAEFDRLEKKLLNSGHRPINPFSLTDGHNYLISLTRDLEQAVFKAEKQRIEKEIWNYCMLADIQALLRCGLVIVLKNWETSKGANLEICIAQKLGIPVLLEETLEPINYSFDITKIKNG